MFKKPKQNPAKLTFYKNPELYCKHDRAEP